MLVVGLIADHTGSTQPPASTPIFTTQYGVTTQVTRASVAVRFMVVCDCVCLVDYSSDVVLDEE